MSADKDLATTPLCSTCGGPLDTQGGKGTTCVDCIHRHRLAAGITAELTRERALIAAGVAPGDMGAFEEPEDGWPTDKRARHFPADRWEGQPWCVFLTGPVGSGKTMLAVELLARFARRHLEAALRSLADPKPCERCRNQGTVPTPTGETPSVTSPSGERLTYCGCAWVRGKVPVPRLPPFSGVFIRASEVPDRLYARRPGDALPVGMSEANLSRIRARAGGGLLAPAGGRWADLLEAELLVLDDLGRGHSGGRWEPLGELVAERSRLQAPTIITSNLNPVDIAEQDAHMVDRLALGLVCVVDGKTRRTLKVPPPKVRAEPGKPRLVKR